MARNMKNDNVTIKKLIKATEKSIAELERLEQEAKEIELNRKALKEAFKTTNN